MKTYIKYLFVASAAFLASCEVEFEEPITDEGFYTTGEANMSSFVAVGNSLTAGFADGALYITGQENSYPNILANQFALAGGGDFTQPLMNDNLGGLLLSGNQISQNRFVLAADAEGNLGPAVLGGMPTTDVANGLASPFNNMGIPGAKSFHLVAPGYGDVNGVLTGTANPYYARIATNASATVVGDAASLNPSFFSLWIGNNDILSYATSGGSGVDQLGNLDPTTYGPNDITDPNVFASVFSQEVEALAAGGSGGVVLNIPDVTSIPFFTTVPVNSVPLDEATAAALNANFALYNDLILPGLVSFGVISAEEAAMRTVSFEAGLGNAPIIVDTDLTDVTTILQGPPANLDPETAALLGQLRQANENDLIVLTAASVLGAQVGDDPTAINGVSVPLANQFVLTATEQARVAAAGAAYNAAIEGIAAANDIAFVDARSALAQVANGGVMSNGVMLTNEFVTGGAFSLDGVHPTPRGYAYTANLIIDAINAKYGATIPKVDIGTFGTITLSND
ncbi:G-D-S-L family lipolytic protein [Gilvibacter sp.]|uniref:G-D-S-L family lipolytic protein n=1 Tax=Gilvibacter sp. TaxID=2729997 RepID=UPI003F4A31A1